MQFNALWQPLVLRCIVVVLEHRHAVPRHHIHGAIVFVDGSYIVVKDGTFLLRYVVNQRHDLNDLGLTHRRRLQTGVHGVAVIEVNEVLLQC